MCHNRIQITHLVSRSMKSSRTVATCKISEFNICTLSTTSAPAYWSSGYWFRVKRPLYRCVHRPASSLPTNMIDDSQVKGLVSREARIEMGPAKLSWEGMMLMWKSSRNPLPNDGGEDYLRCAAVLGHAEHPNVL